MKTDSKGQLVEYELRAALWFGLLNNPVTWVWLVSGISMLAVAFRFGRGRLIIPIGVVTLVAGVGVVRWLLKRLTDHEYQAEIAQQLLLERYPTEEINDDEIKSSVISAIEYRAHIAVAMYNRDSSLVTQKMENLVATVDDWLSRLYDYVLKVDHQTDHESFLERQNGAEFQQLLAEFERMRDNIANSTKRLGGIYTRLIQLETDDVNHELETRLAEEATEYSNQVQDHIEAADATRRKRLSM